MVKQALVVVGCVLSMAAGTALADGLYGGISLGTASVDIDKKSFDDALTSAGVTGLSSKANESDVGYKAYLGYSFNPHFALEGGYANLGSAEYKATFTGGNAKVDWKSHGMFIQAVGRAPMGDSFALLGKGGVYFSENEATIKATGPGGSAAGDASENEVNFVIGLGGEYAFNKSAALRVEWERFLNVGDKDTTGEGDIDLVSVGVAFKF